MRKADKVVEQIGGALDRLRTLLGVFREAVEDDVYDDLRARVDARKAKPRATKQEVAKRMRHCSKCGSVKHDLRKHGKGGAS